MRRLLVVGLALADMVEAGPLWSGGSTVVIGPDGSPGVIRDLGNGIGAYTDSRGNAGATRDLGGGLALYEYASPEGGSQSGLLITPGAARPLGSAPQLLVPFNEQGPVTEQGRVQSRAEGRVESREDVRSR